MGSQEPLEGFSLVQDFRFALQRDGPVEVWDGYGDVMRARTDAYTFCNDRVEDRIVEIE